MPALTFDDLLPSGDTQGGGPLQITVRPSDAAPTPASSKALTFDDLIPESTGAKVGRYAKDIGKSVVSGLDEGVATIAGSPAQLALGVNAVVNYGKSVIQGRPFNDVEQESDQKALISRDAVRKYGIDSFHQGSGLAHKPETTPGEFAHTAASFIPATLVAPEISIPRVLALGVAPGLASEAAGQATKGTALETPARIATAVLAGGGAAAMRRPGSAEQALRSQLPDFVTDAHIARAEQVIQAGAQRGITLTWPEALSQVTGRKVLLDTQRIVENSPQSRAPMEQAIGDRAQQVRNAAPAEMDAIGTQSANPSGIGPSAGTAAEEHINGVRQRINAVADPYYQSASHVLLDPAEMARVRAIPGFRGAADAVRNDEHLNRHVRNLPEDSVGFLNEVKKVFDQQAKNERSPVATNPSMQRATSIETSARDVRDIAARTPHSNDYATALAIEETGRRQFLEPLLQGPIGKIAAKDTPTKDAIAALFPSNPLPNSQYEITTAVGAVAARRPAVAQQLVRAHMESTFNEAVQSLTGGPGQWGGAKFAAILTGNQQQRANLRAAVEALPNGAARWQGFERFLEVLEATGKRQAVGTTTTFNTEHLKSLSGGNMASEAARLGLSPGKWWSVVNDKWSKWQLGHNLNEIAGIITDPGSAQLLQRITRMPPGSREAGYLASRLILQNEQQATK